MPESCHEHDLLKKIYEVIQKETAREYEILRTASTIESIKNSQGALHAYETITALFYPNTRRTS